MTTISPPTFESITFKDRVEVNGVIFEPGTYPVSPATGLNAAPMWRINLLCEQHELYTKDELVFLIKKIAQNPSGHLVRCQTCHRIIPKEVSLQPVGDENQIPVLAQTVGMPDAWIVDGPMPLDSSEVFLVHEKALEAFNDWGKRITPLYKVASALAAQPPAAPITYNPSNPFPYRVYEAVRPPAAPVETPNKPDMCPTCGVNRNSPFPCEHPRLSAGNATERAKAIVEEAWRQTCAGPGEFDDYAVGLIAAAITSTEPQPSPASTPLMDAGSIFTFLSERMEDETSASLAVACRALADHLRVLRAVPQESHERPTRQELVDALQVMVMAWEAKTTVDGRAQIGLSGAVHFPAMPGDVKSSDDAKRILALSRPENK